MSFKNNYLVRKRESESMATLASLTIHQLHQRDVPYRQLYQSEMKTLKYTCGLILNTIKHNYLQQNIIVPVYTLIITQATFNHFNIFKVA
jgi:hypothetical protein